MKKIDIDKAEKKEVDDLKSDIFANQEKKVKEETKAQKIADAQEQPKEVDPYATPEGKDKVSWQCRYKNYKNILSVVDDENKLTIAGDPQPIVVKARNFRIDLDLTNKRDKLINEELKKSAQAGADFWILKDVDRKKDSIKSRAGTLRRLNVMSHAQLMNVLSTDELAECGLLPGTPSKDELIMAIIDTKQLT